jgi:hypothetical protein
VNGVAATAPKRTALAFVKLVPTIVTRVPTTPSSGDRLVMRGVTLNIPLLVGLPAGLMTAIGPVVAPGGTVVRIEVGVMTLKVPAWTPLNRAPVAR